MESREVNSKAPSPEEVRRKLEGGLEVLEAALSSQEELEERLRGVERKSAWKRALFAHLPLLQQVASGQPEVAESLQRLYRRAQVEGWPETLPALALARRLEALQARLKERLERRTGLSAPSEGLGPLLHQLEQLLSTEVPAPRGPQEPLLLQGGRRTQEYLALLAGLALAPLIVCMQWYPVLVVLWYLFGYGGMALLYALWPLLILFVARRSRQQLGAWWLTPERLVWEPWGGEPQQVYLRSIPLAGVSASTFSIQVEDGQGRRVRFHSWQALELAQLVEIYRRPPLLGAERASRPYEAMGLLGEVRRGKSERQVKSGCLLFVRGRVLFIPAVRGEQLLACFTGLAQQPSVVTLPPLTVFHHLRWLPEETFEACLARAMQTPGILSYRAAELELRPPRGPEEDLNGNVYQPPPGLELCHGEVRLSYPATVPERAMALHLLGLSEVEAPPQAAQRDRAGT